VTSYVLYNELCALYIVALVVVQLCLHAVSAEVFTEWMRYDVTQLLAIRLYTLFDICLVHVCAKLQHSVYRPHLHCVSKTAPTALLYGRPM